MTGTSDGLSDDLAALAASYGVLSSYVDHGKVPRHASADVVVAVLVALGETRATSDPRGALAERRRHLDGRLLAPVVVLECGTDLVVDVALLSDGDRLDCRLVHEDGTALEWLSPPTRLTTPSSGASNRGTGELALPGALEPGYHELTVHVDAETSSSSLFVRPVGGARGRFGDDWRAVGLAAPLFTLHSERSWGCGDLTDLDALASMAATHGVSVISTLPLLAGIGPVPFEDSPYLPLSREMWHDRWIDVDAVLGMHRSPTATALADAARRQLRERAADLHPLIDGAGSLAAKRSVLEAILADLADTGGTARDAFEAFLTDRPRVTDYARFRAAGEHLGVAWQAWPSGPRDGVLDGHDVSASAVRYHEFAQWLAHTQLRDVAERCEQRGQVLSLDLPLGAHPAGYDVWRHRDQYVKGISVGAPPDRFFPRGQSWGFPPTLVDAVRRDAHGAFRRAIVHHLNVAGMLRIDHVLGMQRLFWVPDGAEPKDGVYVESPLEELLAVVAIEAQRHRATVVGEDLGTVDAAVRDAMQRDGVRRSFAVELSLRPENDDDVFAPPPTGCAASFTTHDLPTFAGWWLARDVHERIDLGQVDAHTGDEMLEERAVERARLARLVPDTPVGPTDVVPVELLTAAMELLVTSDAGLVVAQLDDLVGELDAVNLPGTSVERTNWRRRTGEPLEAIGADPRVALGLDALRARRPVDDAQGRGGRRVDTRFGTSPLGSIDAHLFSEGRHARLYDKLGANPAVVGGQVGTHFAVWAPNAAWVEVVGDFNGWDGARHPLARDHGSDVWEGFVPGMGLGERYKYRLASTLGGEVFDKADPFARHAELAPQTASITAAVRHQWGDDAWMASRSDRQGVGRPISIYEVHLGSWRRVPEADNRTLTYRELAPLLIDHVQRLGFTHVEFLPVMEHPFYASWGYHVTGFFAPTARYGAVDDFAALVDELHQAGIGVVLDWVPAHFPADAFALSTFDGTHLFEHADPRQGVHPDWHSLIFNYGRNEVRSFLLSAANFWLDCFHVDGLRFDAVASMLYLDYSRAPGEWIPNRLGGRENLDAIEFLTTCNEELHRAHPGALTIAEESTSWPGVTAAVADGGLGFDYKWDLGWMHDTLEYLARDPIHRSWHHEQLTFRSLYATSEEFLLPLSHDEVVHGKGSLLDRMPGDAWQKFANLRLLFGYQLAQPGKKLLFMGDEFGQPGEWAHDESLAWHLLDAPEHRGIAELVAELNALYAHEPALHRDDLDDRGFAWIDGDDHAQSVACIERFDDQGSRLVIVLNATPEPRHDYLVGMPAPGEWTLLVSSDDERFGGSGYPVSGSVTTSDHPWHRRDQSAALVLPPLGFVIYGHARSATEGHGELH